MRILFTRFPLESTYGGAEVQTLSLMKGLRVRGHDVGFLGSCPILLREAVRCQLSAFRLAIGIPPVTKWGVVSFLWRRNAMRKKIIESLRPPHPHSGLRASGPRTANPLPWGEGKFDAICMLSLSEKLLLTEWAAEQGIRVFWIEHDRIGRWLRWNPWLPRLRRLSRLATTVVVSDLSKRMYVALGFFPKRIMVIPNGIDMQRFQNTDSHSASSSWPRGRFQKDSTSVRTSPSPTTYNLPFGLPFRVRGPLRVSSDELRAERQPNTSFRVGTIARLSHEKGVDLLIEAIKDLPNVHLTIVGTGRDEDRIRRMIDGGNSITLLPSIPDVADFYRSLDIFLLPSRDHDPCPLAPIEAMACGIPTILTDACGTAGYLEHGIDAIIVPANSIGALREAILRLQHDEPLRSRLATRGPQVVAGRFSMERMVEQYENLLMKI